MTKQIPEASKIVIIGGGIVGCSTAYHLASMGVAEVLLLEQAKLSSGSTWHAAGLVGQLRTNANITQLLGHSVKLYEELETLTGQATGWKRNGGLRLACTEDRWTEVRRQATTAHSFGLDMQLLSPKEAQNLWPLMQVSDVVGAAFLPTDGQANPSDITSALAKAARQAGATIIEDIAVTDIGVENGRVVSVDTDQGRIQVEKLVCCAGLWSAEIGKLAGVNIPLQAIQHQYIMTDAMDGIESGLPTLRDPDRLIYFKEEVGGLVLGGYEPNPIPWALDGVPDGFHFSLLEEDIDHFEPLMLEALERVPALKDTGIKRFINGPESFTPDGNFILGEAPEIRNFFVGCGFNAFGIAAGGGAGMALAEWVRDGSPPFDLWPVDIRRFGVHHGAAQWVRTRTCEAYAKHYTLAWPQEEYGSGRPIRRSPLYDRLQAEGAVFGEKLGFERPNWFARPGKDKPVDRYSFSKPNWFEAVGEEHRAARETASLFDQSSFAKFEITGRDAEKALSWICSNDVAKPPGHVTYTQMLNEKGGIECDLTVTRKSENCFYIVTGTGFATHDRHWIETNIAEDLDARLIDVTSAYAVLSLMGPNSRAILERASDQELSNEVLPFGQQAKLYVDGAAVTALRITYVGELGYELHIPSEMAATVFDKLCEAGKTFGLRNAGYRAIESLRLEKGYRAWGSDIGPDHTPFMAGLGWAAKLRKQIPFLGRNALLKQMGTPLPRLMAGFLVDDPGIVLLGRETIYRNGKRAGWLTSGGFGYTLGKAIGYGYIRDRNGVDLAYVLDGSYELEVACDRIKANVFLGSPYDPENIRIRG